MTEEQILNKAINKAGNNGWETDKDDKYWKMLYDDFSFELISISIIFSHSFAKAFWDEEPVDTGLLYNLHKEDLNGIQLGEDRVLPAWQYHLQQMVLEENPIKYLEKFL